MGLKKGIDLYKVLIGPFESPETEVSRVSFLPLKTLYEEGAFIFKSNVHTFFFRHFSIYVLLLLEMGWFWFFFIPPLPCLKNNVKKQVL